MQVCINNSELFLVHNKMICVCSTSLGVKCSLRAKFSQILHYSRSWPARQRFKLLHHVVFRIQQTWRLPKSHQVYKYDIVHPHPNEHTSLRPSLASVNRQVHAHANIYTQQRNQSIAHKSGRRFFGMDVRGMRIRWQADAKKGYNIEGREISNFGKEFYKLSFVHVKTSLARVQLTL